MGTYCELYIGDYPVLSSKSEVVPLVMTVFREGDKKVFERRCVERNQVEWGHADWDPAEVETVVEYSATARDVRDRLRIMGFTLSNTQMEFEAMKAAHLEDIRRLNESSGLWTDEIALLDKSSFGDFLEAFNEIRTSQIHPIHFLEGNPTASKLAALLIKNRDEFAWGFPCRDIRFLIRALIEIVPLTSMLIQDITDLVDAGYYKETDRVCDASLLELKGDYSINSRIILLTEGSIDKDVLKEALELLFPHLADYYSFMDLAVRAPGGAGSLVHVVKSFAGAGIENRTIALFDNDAAGHSASSLLQNVPLPHNIRVMTYPDIGLASQYPTSGPGGIAVQDINGSACSIELYFGRDVLTRDGGLIPVKWKGFEDRVQRYQGEIQERDFLKMAFLQKVKTAKSSGLRPPADWDEMRELLEAIFDTFAKEPFE
jgi:hypothetical protein